jgi:hypothetical protein
MKLHSFFLGVCMAIVCTTPGAAESTAPATSTVSVRDFGAVGDGRHDDTDAFLKAVRRSAAETKCVVVPPGRYVTSRPIVLKDQSIAGASVAAWPADTDTLPSILPAHRDGPAFHLLAGGCLQGLDITYDNKESMTTGPAAILVSGVGCMIRDVRIRYAWDGIMADGKSNVGRCNFENIFMASIRNVGVRLTGTWDVPRLHNIEVWNAGASDPGNRGLEHGTGFLLGKNDLVRLTDCFVFGMHYGFLLENRIPGCEIEGETWGTMNGCSTDFCGVGVCVKGTHTLSVSGGSFWDHAQSLFVDGEGARVRVSGSELKSNGAPAVEVRASDHVVVSGCSLLRPMEGFTSPSVLLKSGRTTLGNNHIEAIGAGVQIGRAVRSAAIHGNTIDSHGRPAIIDEHSSSSKVLVEGNIEL